MKVVFENLNNNDYKHSIIFISLTTYSSGIEFVSAQPERTMEEFMYGQDMGNPEDGSL